MNDVIRKCFFERIVVAKFFQLKYKELGKERTLSEVFNFFKVPMDEGLDDYIWFMVTSDYLIWEEHLEEICFKVLGVNKAQPKCSPLMVSDIVLKTDEWYSKWYYGLWVPYFKDLIVKYRYLWEPRMESKINRGDVDIIEYIDLYLNSL